MGVRKLIDDITKIEVEYIPVQLYVDFSYHINILAKTKEEWHLAKQALSEMYTVRSFNEGYLDHLP